MPGPRKMLGRRPRLSTTIPCMEQQPAVWLGSCGLRSPKPLPDVTRQQPWRRVMCKCPWRCWEDIPISLSSHHTWSSCLLLVNTACSLSSVTGACDLMSQRQQPCSLHPFSSCADINIPMSSHHMWDSSLLPIALWDVKSQTRWWYQQSFSTAMLVSFQVFKCHHLATCGLSSHFAHWQKTDCNLAQSAPGREARAYTAGSLSLQVSWQSQSCTSRQNAFNNAEGNLSTTQKLTVVLLSPQCRELLVNVYLVWHHPLAMFDAFWSHKWQHDHHLLPKMSHWVKLNCVKTKENLRRFHQELFIQLYSAVWSHPMGHYIHDCTTSTHARIHLTSTFQIKCLSSIASNHRQIIIVHTSEHTN